MAIPLNVVVWSILLGTGIASHQVVVATSNTLVQKIEQANPALSRPALWAGVRAYERLRSQGKDPQQVLTLVNFNRPSNEKRLWVIDMSTGKTLYFTYVAQGKKTGLNKATAFSNQFRSHESSIGVYLTGRVYEGVDGQSLRLYGLDRRFNDHAFQRHIVIHPAWYVSGAFAKKHGHLGHTYGCFGLNKKLAPKIISIIKNGTVLVAYYPNKQWLSTSRYEKPIQWA